VAHDSGGLGHRHGIAGEVDGESGISECPRAVLPDVLDGNLKHGCGT
jgi:hypothetical protein